MTQELECNEWPQQAIEQMRVRDAARQERARIEEGERLKRLQCEQGVTADRVREIIQSGATLQSPGWDWTFNYWGFYKGQLMIVSTHSETGSMIYVEPEKWKKPIQAAVWYLPKEA